MTKDRKSKIKEITKKAKNTKISILSLLIIFVLLVLFVLFVLPLLNNKPGEQETVTVSSLEKVVKTSTLSTYEIVYNGVAVVMNDEKPDQEDYYIAYESTVKAGLDFSKIEISKNEDSKEIVVKLPRITLEKPNVQIDKQEIIIVNKKMNQDGLSARAYKKSIEDVTEETKNQEAIYEFARQNAEKLISGLITPFVNQSNDEYVIIFNWEES